MPTQYQVNVHLLKTGEDVGVRDWARLAIAMSHCPDLSAWEFEPVNADFVTENQFAMLPADLQQLFVAGAIAVTEKENF